MVKKEELILVDPSEDNRCPEGTKKYLTKLGYKCYRKESGKITWVNESNRIYKSIRRHKNHRFHFFDRFGRRRLKKPVLVFIYASIILMIGLSIYLGFIKLPF